MKTTIISQGAFMTVVTQSPDKSHLSFDWAVMIHEDECIDGGQAPDHQTALQDADDALQEYVDDEICAMEWEGDL